MKRRLRLGMVGGGPGGFIGAVHRIAARLDDRFELVAAALVFRSGSLARSAAIDLHIAPDRAYGSFAEMASGERAEKTGSTRFRSSRPTICITRRRRRFSTPASTSFATSRLPRLLKTRGPGSNRPPTGLLFAVTHNYTGHPMVRQARQMIANGELGPIRVVQVEYAQDWLSTPLEKTGQKQALWRTDPALSGPGGSLGDIGTHAFNLASFVTGLKCRELAAELSTFVPGRRVDDNVQIMLRFAEGARGLLWASQVAPGNQNNLRLRVYGEKAGSRMEAGRAELFVVRSELGKTPTLILTALDRIDPGSGACQPCSSGHPEGYLEAFAQLYADIAEQISARIQGRPADPVVFIGAYGRRRSSRHAFMSAVVESSRRNAAWTALPA